MSRFAPVTDAELTRARTDPAYRRELLQQSLDVLLGALQKQRKGRQAEQGPAATQAREAVELAVRLAELIQGPGKYRPRKS